jgi:hypothetical protein
VIKAFCLVIRERICPASGFPVIKRAISTVNSSASPITVRNSCCASERGAIMAEENIS